MISRKKALRQKLRKKTTRMLRANPMMKPKRQKMNQKPTTKPELQRINQKMNEKPRKNI